MGRKFSFFGWARGASSRPGRDFRRLLVLLGCAGCLIGMFVLFRMIFWPDNGDHPHEKGPHGGMVVAIDKEMSHYHVEVLVEENGRIHLFLSGEHAEKMVDVTRQLLIAQVKRQGEDRSTSLILRPAGKPDAAERKTSHFIGRLSPGLMESRLLVSIDKLEIQGRKFAFQFELAGSRDGNARASELEKALIFDAKGKYTPADVEAAGKQTPSEKYAGINASHVSRAKIGDVPCPVTGVNADRRFRWQVSGKVYQFCCQPCIVEFVDAARGNFETIKEPEASVKKK